MIQCDEWLFLQLHSEEIIGDIQDQLLEATVINHQYCSNSILYLPPSFSPYSSLFLGQVSTEMAIKVGPIIQGNEGIQCMYYAR